MTSRRPGVPFAFLGGLAAVFGLIILGKVLPRRESRSEPVHVVPEDSTRQSTAHACRRGLWPRRAALAAAILFPPLLAWLLHGAALDPSLGPGGRAALIITVFVGIATIALAGSLVVIRMAEMGDVVFAVIGVVLFAIVLGWTAFHLLPDPFEEFNGWFGPTGPIDLESMKNIKINTNGATA